MKVSVISNGSPDYLIDIVTDGLIRLLGRDRVHLRFNQTSTADPYRSQLLNGFGGPNRIDFLEANLLVASVRTNPADIAAWVKETNGGRVAIADGEDDPVIRMPHYGVSSIYYKREFLPGAGYPARVRPLPFAAIPEEKFPIVARDIPVSFSVGITSQIRIEIQGVLKAMGVKADMDMRVKKEYNAILGRSLIGISARGAGWDTYRYWETAYFGCALLSQRMAISIPKNFVDGTEAVFFDGMDDFKKKLEVLLAEPEKAATIGKASQAACMERHLSIHRAKTVLESVL